jgi:FkbM family methyltransferase
MNFLYQAYIFEFKNLNILECGSHSCGSETSTFRNNNNCYYIEANPEDYYNMLNQKDVKRENIFNFALSDSCGDISFTITSWPGNSSVNHSKEHYDELIKYNSKFSVITVPCYTYEYFLDNIIKNTIDLLVLDIEGHESKVLNTMLSLPSEKLPKILCIEAGYDWQIRKNLLLKLGYIIDFYEFNNVFLTHKTFNVTKNIEVIRNINKSNPKFIWHDMIIFENDAEYQ